LNERAGKSTHFAGPLFLCGLCAEKDAAHGKEQEHCNDPPKMLAKRLFWPSAEFADQITVIVLIREIESVVIGILAPA
jgi:hypothetical protein